RLVAARLHHAHPHDGAVGRGAHLDLGTRIAGDRVGVDDVGPHLSSDLAAVAARGAAAALGRARRGFAAGGARQAGDAAQLFLAELLGPLGFGFGAALFLGELLLPFLPLALGLLGLLAFGFFALQ